MTPSTETAIPFEVQYAGFTHQQIEDAQFREICAHGTTRACCGSSMCAVWTISELNDDLEPENQIDPNAIPYPKK